MISESKVRAYITAARQILIYASEARPDTAKTQQMMIKFEMKILRIIQGKTLRDRFPNDIIMGICKFRRFQ